MRFASGQVFDEGQILPAFRQLPAPGVIAGENQGVLGFYNLVRVFSDFFLVMFPHPPKAVHGLVDLET